MDYDLVDQSAEGGFLYFWGREGVRGGATVGELGEVLRAKIVSISHWAGDAVGYRVACLFLLGYFLGFSIARENSAVFSICVPFFVDLGFNTERKSNWKF